MQFMVSGFIQNCKPTRDIQHDGPNTAKNNNKKAARIIIKVNYTTANHKITHQPSATTFCHLGIHSNN
ncbi:UNVERIFIED_CONTAM: hypothetical protein FKN15_075190 [Acipenser sinensis]